MDIDTLLKAAIEKDASDVHLAVNLPPFFRIHGRLLPADFPAMSRQELGALIDGMLTAEQHERFLKERALDCSYVSGKEYQFRVNVYYEKGNVAATIRIISSKIKTKDELGLPSAVNTLINKRKGLIILAGTAGSGKSTTMNYLINEINEKRQGKIVTIEDPVEFVHQTKKSLIVQREVGNDTPTFAAALKYALRQDPDVVVIGEIRDLESISMALTTAETGHLVITTVHAPDAIETISRIIDVFPASKREQIHAQLGENLVAILGQMLLPRKEREDRVLVTEVLMATLPIRNLIRRGALSEIRGQLEAEEHKDMHSYERELSRLVKEGAITSHTALEYSKNPHNLKLPKEAREEHAKVVQATEAAEAAGTGDGSGAPAGEALKKDKVLIVESNEQDGNRMARALHNEGFKEIAFARTSEAALKAINEHKFRLVILAMPLQDAKAFDFCRQLKGLGLGVKVIMITGTLRATDQADAAEAGADGFCVKTATSDLLLKAIRKIK